MSGNDLCSGEELSTAGRLVSAAGLMIGQANAWRRLADAVGISTHVSSAFKLAGSYATKLEAGFVKKVIELLAKKGYKSETDIRTLFDILESLKFREIGLVERFLDSAAKLGVKTPLGTKVYAKIYEALESLPNGLKVQRIREGVDATKIAVIGRKMPGVVGDTAVHLRKSGTLVETYADKDALDALKKQMVNYNGRNNLTDHTWLPLNEVVKSDL